MVVVIVYSHGIVSVVVTYSVVTTAVPGSQVVCSTGGHSPPPRGTRTLADTAVAAKAAIARANFMLIDF